MSRCLLGLAGGGTLANSRMLKCPRQSIGLGLEGTGVLMLPDGPSRPAKNINGVGARRSNGGHSL